MSCALDTIHGIRWNDARARWLMLHAANGLGLPVPHVEAEEFEWVTASFPDSSAMTLYLAARSLADAGRLEDALDVIGDACRAQRCSRPIVSEIRTRPRSTEGPAGQRETRPSFEQSTGID